MFQSTIISLAFSVISVQAFISTGHKDSSSARLSMIRLRMAVIKIPLTSNSISTEIIDDDTFNINNSDGRKPFMGGNWKLNPRSVLASTDLASQVLFITVSDEISKKTNDILSICIVYYDFFIAGCSYQRHNGCRHSYLSTTSFSCSCDGQNQRQSR